jgi:hypothetical protein
MPFIQGNHEIQALLTDMQAMELGTKSWHQRQKGEGKEPQVIDFIGGAGEDRTRDLLTASQALSQLSYSPTPVL